MKMTINAYLAGWQGTEHRQSVTSFSNVFLTGGARRHDFKSRALKIENLDFHGCRFCASQGILLG